MTAEPSDDYRVVILGSEGQDDKKMMSKDGLLIDAGVGKTSLAVQFMHGTFQETYSKTIEDTYRYSAKNSMLKIFFQLSQDILRTLSNGNPRVVVKFVDN